MRACMHANSLYTQCRLSSQVAGVEAMAAPSTEGFNMDPKAAATLEFRV